LTRPEFFLGMKFCHLASKAVRILQGMFLGEKEKEILQNRHNFSKKTRKSPYVDYKFQHVANRW
jgi:hypothetical protein